MTSLDCGGEGRGEHLKDDPDGYREWVGDHKDRAMVPKLMSEKEAVEKLVADGDYMVYECNYLQRGPASLIREGIRQKKTDLWLGAKFTWVAAALLVGGGCASKLDVGFFLFGPTVEQAIREGRVKAYEYSNVVMTNRLMAGAMGLPFIPVRSFGGTDGFNHSGAKLISAPYTGVDAVVHTPFGAYPGEMQGRYASDVPHVIEVVASTLRGLIPQYLEKWVYGVSSHQEMLDKLVGAHKLKGSV